MAQTRQKYQHEQGRQSYELPEGEFLCYRCLYSDDCHEGGDLCLRDSYRRVKRLIPQWWRVTSEGICVASGQDGP